MLLRVLPLLIALALWLAPSSQAAVFVAAPPASASPSTSENACTAFLPNESESQIGLLCANDPLDKTDPMGLDFDGDLDATVVERIEGNRFGITGVNVKVAPVMLKDGDYTLRLDVKVVRREVAQKVIWHGKEVIRKEAQMKVTAEEHEKREHNKDWKGFHDAHQRDVSNTRFSSRPEAQAAAKDAQRREEGEAMKATRQFEKQEHEDKKRWEPILIREQP